MKLVVAIVQPSSQGSDIFLLVFSSVWYHACTYTEHLVKEREKLGIICYPLITLPRIALN